MVSFRLQSVLRLREEKVSGMEILVVTKFVCRGMKVFAVLHKVKVVFLAFAH